MNFKMSSWLVLTILFYCANIVILHETGSGANGNLRLCIVEGRGSYKRGNKYCPILDEEDSGIECVIGTDRLDCLRRIHKGTVDFGAFAPEDLVAAQWADVDVLVTNELRLRNRPYARSIVAVVNRRILSDEPLAPSTLLRNTTLCHPAVDADDLRPLSDTLARYLESLVTAGSCDPKLSLTENRIKETADFFRRACMAGTWLSDKARDAELKWKYPSLCVACASRRCSKNDQYWGDFGALNCMGDSVGDVTWAELDDVNTYYQKNPIADQFAFLCRDGNHVPITTKQPCVWLNQPWNVIVAKRKASEEVSKLTASLTNRSVTVDHHWQGALAALLEVRQELPAPLQPPLPPMDYLSSATGFREAYSQHGCDPPRHVTLCTTSVLESNKCEWLAEAGAVYGIAPPLQCARRTGVEECMQAARDGQVDAVATDADWLVVAKRNYSLTPVLHEALPIIDKMNTVAAYVRLDSRINKIEDLRGKKAAFPRFDGLAWHTVLRYLTKNQNKPCKDITNQFFASICAPGAENYNIYQAKKDSYTQNCYKSDDGKVLNGEVEALRSLVESKSDVAFISRAIFNVYKAKHIMEPWAKELVDIIPVCPEENKEYCLIGWSNIGHIYASSNLTDMKRHEVINVLTKFDQLFGNHAHRLMFSMYGPFNHQLDVLFHNNTRALLTNEMFNMLPYSQIPLNFELSLNSSTVCEFSDFTTGFSVKITSPIVLILSLVFSLMLVK